MTIIVSGNTVTIDGASGIGSQSTGAGTLSSNGSIVTGTGTSFNTAISVNDYIVTVNFSKILFAKVTAISSATSLTIETIGGTEGWYDGVSWTNMPTGTTYLIVKPAKLSDIVSAVNNTTIFAGSAFGFTYTMVNMNLVHQNNGWVIVQNSETLTKQGSFLWTRTSGGLIIESTGMVQNTGNGAGMDPSNNSMRSGFYLCCKYNPLNQQRARWFSNTSTRDDGFTFFASDESNATLGRYSIQGLFLESYTSISSWKVYQTSNSFINNLYFRTNVNSEFQLSTKSGPISLENLVLEGAVISTSIRSSSSNPINLYNPAYVVNGASQIRFGNINGGSGLSVNLYDPLFIGGSWNFQTSTTYQSANLQVFYSQQITYLSGTSAIENVRSYFVSSNSAVAPTLNILSNSNGQTGVQYLLLAKQTSSTTVSTATAITWSIYARSYNYDVPYQIVSTKTYSNPDNSSYQGVLNATVQLTAAQAAALTNVSIAGTAISFVANTTINQLHDYSRYWLWQPSQMLSASPFSVSGNIFNAGAFSLSGAEYATLGSSLTAFQSSNTITFLTKANSPVSFTGILQLNVAGIWAPILANATVRFTAAGSYDLRTATITGTLTLTNTSGGAVTVRLAPGLTIVNSGPNITVDQSVDGTGSITNIVSGSRIQIYNVTTATELVNAIVSGTSYTYSYTVGTQISSGNTIRVRLTYQSGVTAKARFESLAVAGATGFSVLAQQTNDEVYNLIGIDGSTATEFSADYPNVEVNVSDPDNSTSVSRMYAWWVSNEFTADGIRQFFGGIDADDAANFKIVTSRASIKIDNTSSTGVTFTGDIRLYRDDGATPLVASTTGGGSITLYAGKVYTVETGVSGLTPAESAKLMSIPDATSNANAVWAKVLP